MLEDYLLSNKQELASHDFKHYIRDSHLALRSDVDVCMGTVLIVLYGAAACLVRTVGEKKNVNDCRFLTKNVKEKDS